MTEFARDQLTELDDTNPEIVGDARAALRLGLLDLEAHLRLTRSRVADRCR